MAESNKGADAPKRKTVVTPVFRVSFPSVFEKSQFGDGKPKYGLAAVWEPEKFTDADKKLWAAMGALADEASMSLFKKPVKQLADNFKKPVRDGVEKEHLDGYGAGKKFANMTSHQKPGLVDRNKQPIIDQEQFYAGCYARALVTAYAYDNKGKGVAFGLMNIQKVSDGEAFSGRVAAEDSFDDDLGPVEGAEASGKEADPF